MRVQPNRKLRKSVISSDMRRFRLDADRQWFVGNGVKAGLVEALKWRGIFDVKIFVPGFGSFVRSEDVREVDHSSVEL